MGLRGVLLQKILQLQDAAVNVANDDDSAISDALTRQGGMDWRWQRIPCANDQDQLNM